MRTRTVFLTTLLVLIVFSVQAGKAAPAQRRLSATGKAIAGSSTSSARLVPAPNSLLSSVLLQEDFSTASDSTPPSGWSNNTIEGLPTDRWRFDNPGNRTVSFNATQPAAVFDSDFLSGGLPENVALESPAFSAPLNSNISLQFKQFFRSNPSQTEAIVEAFDGVRWVIVDSTNVQTADPASTTIDLTPQVAGVNNARIRFRFRANFSWWWFVDDIVVTETPIAPTTRLLLENFKTASGSTPPTGWTMNRMLGQPTDVWRYDNPGGRIILPPFAEPVAIFDSDTLSRLSGPEDVALESPAFSAPANATIMLSLDHFFRGDSGGRGTIEVFNGTTWVAIWDSVDSTPNPDKLNLDITPYVSGMNNAQVRFRWRAWWAWWWIIDNVMITETPTNNVSAIASDQFNNPTLNTSVWTFENPLNDASYALTGTQLSITVPAGLSHDITETGNNAPRVMQNVSNPLNFDVYVKFDGLMNQAYQTQGIQIREDALNFLRLEFYGDGANLNRLAWSFVNGVHQEEGSAGLGLAAVAPIYMKVTRQGDTWSQYWSVNGLNYNLGTSFTRTMNVTRVGVYSGNVGFPESATPAFTGLIDYFMTTDPLPIQLARFTAITTSANHVQLDWTTLTETNNYGFEIQKSLNSQSGFQTVPNSFIPGHGTTLVPHQYTWTDAQTTAGVWFYRLKQTDLDGTVNYSEPVQANVLTGVAESAPKVFSLSQNYPNPFNPSTGITFSVEKTGHASLEVYNVLGQKVTTLFDDIAQAGQYYRMQFLGSNMASGIYFYKLTSGARSDLKKMIMLK